MVLTQPVVRLLGYGNGKYKSFPFPNRASFFTLAGRWSWRLEQFDWFAILDYDVDVLQLALSCRLSFIHTGSSFFRSTTQQGWGKNAVFNNWSWREGRAVKTVIQHYCFVRGGTEKSTTDFIQNQAKKLANSLSWLCLVIGEGNFFSSQIIIIRLYGTLRKIFRFQVKDAYSLVPDLFSL